MNSYIKKRILLLTVLFSLLYAAGAQSNLEVFNNGVKLWEGGACREACTEFKRYIFVSDYDEHIDAVEAEKIGDSYRYLSLYAEQTEDFYGALQYLQEIQNYKSTDQDLIRKINLYRKLTALEDYSVEMEVDLWAFRFMENYSRQVRVAAWKAVLGNSVEYEDWEMFEADYRQFTAEFPEVFSQEDKTVVESSLIKLKNFAPKNPEVAVYMSVIPGLGQLYAGDVKDSLNAFILNGGLITLSVFSLCTGGIAEFCFFEADPAYRFYRGNFYNARKASINCNQKQVKKLKAPIEELLEP